VRELYQVLGVRRGATQADIQRAYRRKAKVSHPDIGGSVEAFGELATAYAVLSDAERRERYDLTGEIELPRPNNLDVSAIEVIAQKLGMIIHAEHDVTSMDIGGLIERAIREDIAEREANISSQKRAIERAARLRDRVKRKSNGKDNALARVLDWHELSTKGQIKKNEEAVGSMERALEILKDYSFADDLSLVTPDEVSVALYETLRALDQLAVVLDASHAGAEMNLDAASPGAFG
jgi:curved DNA-binding protein CbpA